MKFGETVLAKLAEWRPDSGRHLLPLSDEGAGWSLVLAADRCDSLGCLVWELSLRRSAPSAGGPEELRGWADRVAARVTGLMEPLEVLEVDAGRNEALLRSGKPSARAEKVYYYEVLLKGLGSAQVRRFQGSHQAGTRREQVTFALTHEALAKLVDDLTAE